MAKTFLWFVVYAGLIIAVIEHTNGGIIDNFTRVIVLASLGVLALCESIEKQIKRG